MGGIDWAGLPYVVAQLGITDVAGLIESLRVIRLHDPKRNDPDQGVQPPAQESEDADATGNPIS